MKQWKTLLLSGLLLAGAVSLVASAPDASAINVFNQCGGGGNGSAVCASSGETAAPLARTIVNTLLIILGMISVIMIVIGGVKYTTSNGDSASVKSAKDTILYAIIGLILAILSFSIVNFVIGRF